MMRSSSFPFFLSDGNGSRDYPRGIKNVVANSDAVLR